MCGISGVAGREVSDANIVEVRNMCTVLKHRGPDDSGIYSGNGVVIGQSRLSIIDLESGRQPISNERKNVWVACNGEIYNYIELKKELQKKGHVFATSSDTEVIVHLYEEKGMRFLDDLNGMFAFALWDENSRKLFLVRDRLGIKPLYYSLQSDKLFFASELKALLGKGISTEIDREAIAEYLTLSYIPDPKTPFVAIKKLTAGSYMEYSEGNLKENRYWRVPLQEEMEDISENDHCERILYLLEDSAKLQLRSDVPVGVFSSGGLDSTAIMWGAYRNEVSLDAFLVEFDELSADTPFARMASKSTGMNLIEKKLTSTDAGALLPKLIWYLDEPLADSAILPCYLIAKEAVEKVKVILNGTGGDELFGGYHRYFLKGLLPPDVSHKYGYYLSNKQFLNHRIAGLVDYRQRYYRRISVFPERDVRNALGLKGIGSVQSLVNNLFRECLSNDPYGSMMYVDMNLYLPGDLFMMLDKMTMAVSLEARVPLLDHRLVEYMATIPGSIKMKDGELKWLLRKALRGKIPDQILDRPKQGFGPPVKRWMHGPLGNDSFRLVTSKNSRIKELFKKGWIDVFLKKSPSELYPGRLWSLLTLELWWRNFIEGIQFENTSIHEIARGE